MRCPFLGLLIASLSGILVEDLLGEGPLLPWALLAGSLIFGIAPSRGGVARAVVFLGFALLHFWNWSEAPARKLAGMLDSRATEYRVSGIVAAEPRIHAAGAVFPLDLEEISPVSDSLAVISPACRVQVRWSGPPPSYGDRVQFRCRVGEATPPANPGGMDYRRWLERHGIWSIVTVDPSLPGTIVSGGHGNPLMAAAFHSRHRMNAILSLGLEDAPEAAAAIRGICLGVTDGAPEGFTEDFRFTGTMHLFAVSGLHVGMVAVILWFFLALLRLPRPLAALLTVLSLVFYVLVTGLKMGSIRSACMASLLILGITLLRRSPLLNTLAAAAFLQLAFDTNALFSAGWQFSYAVVGAIVLMTPALERSLESLWRMDPFLPPSIQTRSERGAASIWRGFSGLAAVSAAAWIGSLIPTVAYFHLISLSALGANLLAVPLAFGVLSLGALALLGGMLSPWIASAFNNANWIVAKLLLLVIGSSALLPGGHWFVGSAPPPSPELTLLELKGGRCAVIRSGWSFCLLDTGNRRDAREIVLPCLEAMGANFLREIVITSPDARHAGGLSTLSIVYRIGTLERILPAGKPARTEGAGNGPKPGNDPAPVNFPKVGGSLRPLPGVVLSLPAETEHGPVILVQMNDTRILFLPDATTATCKAIGALPVESCRSDVLAVPLGGAAYADVLDLVRRTSVRMVLTPVDRFRREGMPGGEWESLLRTEGVEFLRTDRSGAVTVAADPTVPRVTTCLPQRRTFKIPPSPPGMHGPP